MGKDGTDESVADVHVLFVAIIGTINFGLLRGTCCAITFYRPRRQSRIVRILPVASLLLAVVSLLFLIVVSGDLGKEADAWETSKKKSKKVQTPSNWLTLEEWCSQGLKPQHTNLNIFLCIWFPVTFPFFVFTLLFLAAGALPFFTAALFIAPTVPVPFLLPLLLFFVSEQDGKWKVQNKISNGYMFTSPLKKKSFRRNLKYTFSAARRY